jgi:DNA mismatch endonuclease (patch repair protein)
MPAVRRPHGRGDNWRRVPPPNSSGLNRSRAPFPPEIFFRDRITQAAQKDYSAMDNRTKSQRSYNMSRILRRDTTPELMVRRSLHRLGFRFRRDDVSLPGRPDIVLPKHRLAIFVNGCFWHKHDCPRGAVIPKTNESYWASKRVKTAERDLEAVRSLSRMGWKPKVIWECEIHRESKAGDLEKFLLQRLFANDSTCPIITRIAAISS